MLITSLILNNCHQGDSKDNQTNYKQFQYDLNHLMLFVVKLVRQHLMLKCLTPLHHG